MLGGHLSQGLRTTREGTCISSPGSRAFICVIHHWEVSIILYNSMFSGHGTKGCNCVIVAIWSLIG